MFEFAALFLCGISTEASWAPVLLELQHVSVNCFGVRSAGLHTCKSFYDALCLECPVFCHPPTASTGEK